MEFLYPTSEELAVIVPELQAQLTADDPIFKLFPIRNVNSHILRWRQRDNYRGMMNVRGLDGKPGQVKLVGAKEYTFEPGVYGEFVLLNEKELTERAQMNSNAPINVSDLVAEADQQLTHRRIVRWRYQLWTLVTTGTFTSVGEDGVTIIHTDAFDIQTATRAVDWDTAASATPMADLRTVQALGAARGTDFGAAATAYMNRATFNKMMANTLSTDLGGQLARYINPAAGLADVNKILAGADLPQIELVDDGYEDADGNFTRFLPTDYVVVIGKRPGNEPLGEYRLTRNLVNPNGAPGVYAKVTDNAQSIDPVPPQVKVHHGFNGGPVLYYPGSIVALSV